MSYCPGVLDKAWHKVGTWWVIPASTPPPVVIVLVPSYCLFLKPQNGQIHPPKLHSNPCGSGI